MEKRISFRPAFDKREAGYGIHGVELRFQMIGLDGAVEFLLFTNWMLPQNADGLPDVLRRPMPANLDFHSRKPFDYQAQEDSRECRLLGGPCWSDGSALNAEPVYERLLREGDDGVWAALGEFYNETFGKKD